MRPIKLTMCAFGPYANKQIIDFEELKGRNIFVISGKTGAGKTTIFDAISYALYGEASGESRETDSLRSHFSDDDVETYVELEFELRGKTYTVNRIPKQKKKKTRGEGYTEKGADATLTLPDGKVITKVKPVTDKLIEILGITKEQFKQIVMLPQGEFKKLLLADSLERESIFRKIFNTYDFEKIQLELKDKAIGLSKKRSKSKDKMQTHLESIKGEHDITIDEYVDFPLVIENLKELIETNKSSYKNIEKEAKEIEDKLKIKNIEKANIENNNNLLKEKEELINIVNQLISKKEEFDNKKIDIKNASNAREIKYIEDKFLDVENKIQKRESDYKLSLNNIERLKLNCIETKESLKLEEAKDKTREKLTIEIDTLKNIQPKIIELDTLNIKVKDLNKNAKEVQSKIIQTKASNESLKKDKIYYENTLKDISSLETKKVEIENDINNNNKVLDDIRGLFKVIKSYENDKLNHFNLSNEYSKFDIDYLDIKNNFNKMDDLYKKEQAGILATQLKENSPCPVCGSNTHPNPAKLKYDIKIPTKEELKLAKENLDKFELDKTSKLNSLTKLKSDIDNKLDFIEENLIKFSTVLNIDVKYDETTYTEVTLKGKELKIIIDEQQNSLQKIINKIALKDSINNKVKEIEECISLNEKSLITLEETEKIYLKDLTEIATKIDEYKKDIPENIQDIKTLTNTIEIKCKELKESKLKLSKLREENEIISKKLEGEVSTSNEIYKSILELKIERDKLKIDFENSLTEFNFKEKKLYDNAKMLIDNIDVLQKQVEDYDSKLNLAQSKKEYILNKTKDLLHIDLMNINDKIILLEADKKNIYNKKEESHSILDANKYILKSVETLNVEFKEIEDEYRVVGELADLATGKKSPYISFERYILASYFQDIIEAANIRLEKMTGDRFTLIRKTTKSKGAGQKGLELEIYDNYTDSSRDVSSLSGGESFKASLSLALGLSDVVQSNAGGVSLDTMFVDEGFGTLDPQSLDNAIDSLLELQRGGRLVGIISHVEELKERIDAKLEVISTSKGSRANFNIL
ncbi:MAG: AAA family ATPase [Peptostreptococcaceae bacterium]